MQRVPSYKQPEMQPLQICNNFLHPSSMLQPATAAANVDISFNEVAAAAASA
jgi:hypothetical protein